MTKKEGGEQMSGKKSSGKNGLLDKAKVEYVSGPALMELKTAAKLAGIETTVLEMGMRLIKRPDGEGVIFRLALPEMLQKANEIELLIRDGLKKVAKALSPGPLSVKSYRKESSLIFWYATGGPGIRRSGAKNAV